MLRVLNSLGTLQGYLYPHKIVTVIDGKQIGGPDVTGTWYPSLNGFFQCVDGTPPVWMTASVGYSDAYVFDSHAECCKAHWCEPQRDMFP